MESLNVFLADLQSRATDGIRVHGHLTAFQGAAQKTDSLLSISDPASIPLRQRIGRLTGLTVSQDMWDIVKDGAFGPMNLRKSSCFR